MAMSNIRARVQEIRVLSKWKPTLKRRILKEENIIEAMLGHSMLTYKIENKTKIECM
jgi:hypothetical protein